MRNVKCSDCNEYRNEWCKKVKDSPHPDLVRDCQYWHERKGLDDSISRQAAIDAIERKAFRHTYIDQICGIINELPSAQPEIIRCKDCIRYHEPSCLMAYDGKEWSEDNGFCHAGEKENRMTKDEAVNWMINISADIGKAEHRELWHYEQALSEIREMLESEPERKKGKWTRKRTMVHDGELYCNQCGQEHPEQKRIWSFCPNCGADMREDRNYETD